MRSLSVFLLLLPFFALSQEPNTKFGKISAEDLKQTLYSIGTAAPAVVLFDIGATKFIGNDKGWFTLEFKRRFRIHVLKKNGFELATLKIPIYKDGESEERIKDIKASTFNLENGKVVETKFEKSDLFSEKIDKYRVYKKITFPAVKEGSIIECEYKMNSDFLFNMQPWNFQSEVPHLWSEYNVTLPQFFVYTLIGQGDLNYFIKSTKDSYNNFSVLQKREIGGGIINESEERLTISCNVTDFRWVLKDVPAITEESFTTTIDNYKKRLEFQLAEFRDPLIPKKIITTWSDFTADLLKKEDFGGYLKNDESFLKSEVSKIIGNASTQIEKAKRIYTFLQSNFTCTDFYQLFTEHTLKEVYKTRNGSVAELNLLCVALLRAAGIAADPVILNRRQDGTTYKQYPVVSRFHYVICRAEIDNKMILLDATRTEIGFGKLHYDLYNDHARVINEDATAIELTSDQLLEQSVVNIIGSLSKDKFTGNVQELAGYYESATVRSVVKKMGENDFFVEHTKSFVIGTEIMEGKIDSLNNTELPLQMEYKISNNTVTNGNIIYFTPVLLAAYSENPFTAAQRRYPVEMPYKLNEQYIINISLPGDYEVEEMPASATIRYGIEGDIVFDYKIVRSDNRLTVRWKMTSGKTYFGPGQYNGLREFYDKIAAKLKEQVVLKKK